MPSLYIEMHAAGETLRRRSGEAPALPNLCGIVVAMESGVTPTRLQAILRGLCPRCRVGKIFSRSLFAGLPKMNDVCPSCGLKFEREQGYFLGALYMSYAMAVPLMALLVAIFWL